MSIELFVRYLLHFLILLPACVLCYLPMGGSLRTPRAAVVHAGLWAVFFVLAGSAACTYWELSANRLLLPCLILCLGSLFFTTNRPWYKLLFAIATPSAVMATVTWGSVIYCSPFEVMNPYPSVASVETSLVTLAAASLVTLLMAPLMLHRIRWLMDEFEDARIWHVTWVFPCILAVLMVLFMPMDFSTLQVNRYRPIGVAFSVILLALLTGFLLFFCFMARVLTDRASLEQEMQLLMIQEERYAQLHASVNETRTIRHDFRQHLRVIVGLAEKEKYAELRDYLRQYESEMVDDQLTLCPNAAMDAIAHYYDQQARKQSIPLTWRLELPEKLPLLESDLCMILGNLTENALHATAVLPESERHIEVICRMMSEGMVGLSIRNTWDSAGHGKHRYPKGQGIGMKSVQAAVKKYDGTMDIQADDPLFSVHLLLNIPQSTSPEQ